MVWVKALGKPLSCLCNGLLTLSCRFRVAFLYDGTYRNKPEVRTRVMDFVRNAPKTQYWERRGATCAMIR